MKHPSSSFASGTKQSVFIALKNIRKEGLSNFASIIPSIIDMYLESRN
ncbi:hypothetical protein GAGA_0503 [Paraglaciecola agarilytica NO2]|uniref:Uncharacterized protein n=1 Tax=Paraglaciecola agarilytica NO2 TaxID=1125747 RepID=A0ABQ0I228_9ALTE|nr:hypothetical protein GAGA_0503 [Paraglaciecola agarilytica NO2]